MANTLGISFSPFGDPSDPNSRRDGAGGVPTPQDAIKLISLRMPRVIGASAPAPQALLTGPGAARFGASGLPLEFLLETLFGRRPTPSGRFEFPGLQAPWEPPSGGGTPQPPAGGGGGGGRGGEHFDFNEKPGEPVGGGTTVTSTSNPFRRDFGGFNLSERRRA